MSPTFFITICIGGILCLTPLAIYLFWLASVNRKNSPTVVSGAWDFVATLCGLGGFLFCLGVLLGVIVLDASLFTGGPFARIAVTLPWLQLAWVGVLVIYLLLVARAIRKGLARRKGTLCVYNIDRDVLASVYPLPFDFFPAFCHAVLNVADAAMEAELRETIVRLPAARDNPASPWLGGITTCCAVSVGCCITLIFALPFLR